MNALRKIVEDTASGAVAAFTTNRLPLTRKPGQEVRRTPVPVDALVARVERTPARGYHLA
jgi:hypothetical protein